MKIEVCIGSACHLKGSYNIISTFQQMVEEHHLSDAVEVKAAFCFGHCAESVAVRIDDGEVYSVSGAEARDFFDQHIAQAILSSGVKA